METKTKKVMEHLLNIGNITSWEAIELYRATRLSGIIFNLRHHYNMNIISEVIDKSSNAVKYILVDKEAEDGTKKNV